MRDCQTDISRKMVDHNVPRSLSSELRILLVYSCHRISKTREIASRYLNRLITTFPSLLCNESLVFAILEVLTMLRRACEGEYTDEVRIGFIFLDPLPKVFSSSTPYTNFLLTELGLHLNSLIRIQRVTRFFRSCIEMRTIGFRLLWGELLWSSRQFFRYVYGVIAMTLVPPFF